MVCVSSSPVSRQLSDDSYRPTPLSPLNISPLLLPASTSRTSPQQQHLIDSRRMSSSWDVPHTVELVRKPGDSLGISIVGGLQLLCTTNCCSQCSVGIQLISLYTVFYWKRGSKLFAAKVQLLQVFTALTLSVCLFLCLCMRSQNGLNLCHQMCYEVGNEAGLGLGLDQLLTLNPNPNPSLV